VQLTALALTFRHTLSDREGYVVDVSAELVEKDMQIEQMGTQIHQLQEEVHERGITIEILENQLHDLQIELDDANEHIETHHEK
jgi:peptidoglycan hydrolase CwlO-like protein